MRRAGLHEGEASSIARVSAALFELLEDSRQEGWIALLNQVFDPGRWELQLGQHLTHLLPEAVAFLRVPAKIDVGHELREPLRLDCVIISIVTLDDLLLIR